MKNWQKVLRTNNQAWISNEFAKIWRQSKRNDYRKNSAAFFKDFLLKGICKVESVIS